MSYDFRKVEPAKSGTFLTPGKYKLAITGAAYVKPEGTKNDGSPKTPYVEVTFSGAAGQMKEQFYITPKAVDRLQYLHEAWYGKRCEKVLDTADEVGAYFEKVLPMKPDLQHGVIVDGIQQPDGRVFTTLMYSGFVISDDTEYTEGAFEKGSTDWILHVAVKRAAAPVANTDDVMVGGGSNTPKADFNDDLPF